MNTENSKERPDNLPLERRIRAALESLGEATVDEVAEYLRVQTYAERRRVRRAVADLARRGIIEAAPHRWRLKEIRAEKQVRLWRAVGLKAQRADTFTAQDLAALADCGADYASRYLAWLVRQGVLEEVGRRRNFRVFRAVSRAALAGARPHWGRLREEAIRRQPSAVSSQPEEHRQKGKA